MIHGCVADIQLPGADHWKIIYLQAASAASTQLAVNTSAKPWCSRKKGENKPHIQNLLTEKYPEGVLSVRQKLSRSPGKWSCLSVVFACPLLSVSWLLTRKLYMLVWISVGKWTKQTPPMLFLLIMLDETELKHCIKTLMGELEALPYHALSGAAACRTGQMESVQENI